MCNVKALMQLHPTLETGFYLDDENVLTYCFMYCTYYISLHTDGVLCVNSLIPTTEPFVGHMEVDGWESVFFLPQGHGECV